MRNICLMTVAVIMFYGGRGAVADELQAYAAAESDRLLASTRPADWSDFAARVRGATDEIETAKVQAVKQELQGRLTTAEDAAVLRKASLLLLAAPNTEAVQAMTQRLAAAGSVATRHELCLGLARLAERLPVIPAEVSTPALDVLNNLIHDTAASQDLVDEAMMATAAFGAAGFERLVQLKADPDAPEATNNLYYTALGATKDIRSLAILRQTLMDSSAREGSRLEAAHALGQAFWGVAATGGSVGVMETGACIMVLKRQLAKPSSDQLYAASLGALGKISGAQHDPIVRLHLLASLGSKSERRREAALDVLYQDDTPLEELTVATIQQLAQVDPSESVRSAARSILDKIEAQQFDQQGQ